MHTPLIGSLAMKYNNGDVEGLIKKRDSSVPMGKMGESFDTAYSVLFLASQCARHVSVLHMIHSWESYLTFDDNMRHVLIVC